MGSARAYYNEFDPFAAQWLRNLIDGGHIAPGDVDERSIEDVRPDDLLGYTQCHFFAGIGGWSLALRLAGWPDDEPVWTGSCPCQPFSAAGKASGFDDERHLWPAFAWLIAQHGPSIVFGEQVASRAAELWIDLVQADMEAMDYAFGCIAFPAASLGAPHIRDRAYWLGHRIGAGLEGHSGNEDHTTGWPEQNRSTAETGSNGGLANSDSGQQQRKSVVRGTEPDRQDTRWAEGSCEPESPRDIRGMADTDGSELREARPIQPGGEFGLQSENGSGVRKGDKWPRIEPAGKLGRPGPTNGQWRDADWLYCRDGKWRPVEPGTFPLAHGVSNRVGKLRGYGNAIVPAQAAEFIRAFREYLAEEACIEVIAGMHA